MVGRFANEQAILLRGGGSEVKFNFSESNGWLYLGSDHGEAPFFYSVKDTTTVCRSMHARFHFAYKNPAAA
jgi:hypothetical protein